MNALLALTVAFRRSTFHLTQVVPTSEREALFNELKKSSPLLYNSYHLIDDIALNPKPGGET